MIIFLQSKDKYEVLEKVRHIRSRGKLILKMIDLNLIMLSNPSKEK